MSCRLPTSRNWMSQTRTLSGFEALLRWNHPILGDVSPVLFIPLAEEIGCIVALGEWVLRTACKEAARWPAPLAVAVNVSPRQLEDGERLFNAVEAALETSGLAGERLELEISESSLLSSAPHVLETLHRLRARGVRIAMDDFGTGILIAEPVAVISLQQDQDRPELHRRAWD